MKHLRRTRILNRLIRPLLSLFERPLMAFLNLFKSHRSEDLK